jgi:hypothetical protein
MKNAQVTDTYGLTAVRIVVCLDDFLLDLSTPRPRAGRPPPMMMRRTCFFFTTTTSTTVLMMSAIYLYKDGRELFMARSKEERNTVDYGNDTIGSG